MLFRSGTPAFSPAPSNRRNEGFPKAPYPADYLLPESAKTGESLENRRLKTVFKPMDGGSPVERFLRGTVYSAITRFCQWPVPFIPCRIGPRRGHALPGAQQDEPRPGDARRVQPLGARDEPFADARGPAGDVIQKKRHVRADAGGQPDELRQGRG